MGWYIRKSKKLGPFNFNLSKSGVGISTGIKGARLSFGPKGTYVNFGRNGIYYRKKIGVKNNMSVSSNDRIEKAQKNYNQKFCLQGNTVKTYDNSCAKVSLEQEMVKDIKKSRLFFLLWLMIFVLLYDYLQQLGVVISLIVLMPMLQLIHPKFNFEFDDESKLEWEKTAQIFYNLKVSKKIWLVKKETINSNIKTSAGAYRNISRGKANVALLKPKRFTGFYVKTDTMTVLIKSKKCKILFMPNGVLIKKGLKYFAYPYKELAIYASTTRFVESGLVVASDAELVDRTWQFVNRDGSPDRRYKNNKQFPVYNYGSLTLMGNDFSIELQTSNKIVVNNIYNAYTNYIAYIKKIELNTYEFAEINSDFPFIASEERKILEEANEIVKEFGRGKGLTGILEKSLSCKIEFVDGQVYKKHHLLLYKASQLVNHKLKATEDFLNASSPYRCEIVPVNGYEFLVHLYMKGMENFNKELPLSDVLKNALEKSNINLKSYRNEDTLVDKTEKDINNVIGSILSNKSDLESMKNDSCDDAFQSSNLNNFEDTDNHLADNNDTDDFMDYFKEE